MLTTKHAGRLSVKSRAVERQFSKARMMNIPKPRVMNRTMQTRMFHPINLLSVCYKHILRFTSMVKIIKRNAGHKHKFQLLFGYFTFQGRHSRAKICFTASEQSSSSRESMFAWPFSLPEIPTWKHLGWGSWTTPNNQWFSYKQHYIFYELFTYEYVAFPLRVGQVEGVGVRPQGSS